MSWMKWEEHCEAILVLWCVILSCGWLYSSQRSTKSLASLQPAATKAAEVELHQCLKKDLPELGSLPTLCTELKACFLKTALKTTIVPTKWLAQMNTSELPCILLQFSNIFVNGPLETWNCKWTYGGLTSKGRNYAQSHSITHISPKTTEAFVGQMLNYRECRVVLSVLQKWKNKNPSATWMSWHTTLECVGVTRAWRGGNRVRTAVDGFEGLH